MLRRFLTIWLVISMLGYGLAVVGDLHGERLAADLAGHELPDADESPIADTGCGHCSHGIQHLVGLENSFGFQLAQMKAALQGEHLVSLPTPPLRSLYRPPISI